MAQQQGPPRLSNAQHRALRHMPGMVNHLERLARKAIARSGKADLYEVIVQNDPGTRRARVYIRPKGIEGMIDDAENGTILKMQAAMRGAG